MVPINTLGSTMRGLLQEFQLKHGVKASLAQRKEPLRNEHIRALLSLWCDQDNVGKTVAKLVIGESEAETVTVRAIWQLLLETGSRLSEITDDHWDIRPIQASLTRERLFQDQRHHPECTDERATDGHGRK